MTPPAQTLAIYRQQAELFKTLGHPARIAILKSLGGGEQCVCHLEAALGSRQSYISQHLMALREVGLVEDRRDGWNIYYRLTSRGIRRIRDALGSVTGGHAHRLAAAVAQCPCPRCKRSSRAKRAARILHDGHS